MFVMIYIFVAWNVYQIFDTESETVANWNLMKRNQFQYLYLCATNFSHKLILVNKSGFV